MVEQVEPVSFDNVKLENGFWAKRQKINADITLPLQYERCKETGRINALNLEWSPENDVPKPHEFWDSDVAKWIEAAAYSLSNHTDEELERKVDSVIDQIAEAQQPDGYFNSHFMAVNPQARWTNLRDAHELYCAGHMMEAAVAYAQATGQEKLLNVMCDFADHIEAIFGPEPGQKRGYPGHEEIELALMKLHRATGKDKYLNLAKFFVDERGTQPHYFEIEARQRGENPDEWDSNIYEYNQSHRPLREQTDAVGHAVRAMYLYSGATDVAAQTGDSELLDALHRLWRSTTQRRMYITGGIGATDDNEGFTEDYDLPNETAYAETCAAISLTFFAHRMLQIEPDAKYADIMERCIYNGIISGVSLDGDRFFYVNPLASQGDHHRKEWFDCACCPPNLARFLASLGGYAYSCNTDTIYTHLFIDGTAEIPLGRATVTLETRTEYPWEESVEFTIGLATQVSFSLALRMPGWCNDATVRVNDERQTGAIPDDNGYIMLNRTWQDGDIVSLDLSMPVEPVEARSDVWMDAGRVALQRGSVVYCLEETDNGPYLNDICLAPDAEFTVERSAHVLDGMPLIKTEALRRVRDGGGSDLYRQGLADYHKQEVTAVPYFAWDNRENGEMQVWINHSPSL